MVVVFPTAFGFRKPNTSPASIIRVKSSTAAVFPKCRESQKSQLLLCTAKHNSLSCKCERGQFCRVSLGSQGIALDKRLSRSIACTFQGDETSNCATHWASAFYVSNRIEGILAPCWLGSFLLAQNHPGCYQSYWARN